VKTLLISILLLIPTITFATIPDFSNCYATCAYYGPVSLFVLPDGSGQLLTEANNGPIDATITVTLLDLLDDPIVLYPAEDVYLETSLDGMVACSGGVNADGPSDMYGNMTFTSALRAGGFSAIGEQMVVLINGMPLIGYDLDIKVNSADIDANGIVNLSDIVQFAGDMGSYNFRSDFYQDGVLNLVDVIFMASSVGCNCP